jgi:hypothetical protein
MNASELLTDAYRLPYQERKEQFLRVADLAIADNDLDLAFRAHTELVRSSHNDPDMRAAITSYGWCLARHDDDPNRFPIELWYYKWIVSAAANYYTIRRDQIRELLDDFDARYQAANASRSAVLKERTRAALLLGDDDQVRELHGQWLDLLAGSRHGAGRENDCYMCDVAHEASMAVLLGEDRRAVELGRAIDLRLRCADEPHHVLGDIVHAARREGDADLAQELLERGRSLIGDDRDFRAAAGPYLRHMAITGQIEEGRAWIQRLGATDEPEAGNPASRFAFARGVRLIELAAGAADPTDADALAAAFDARNGNGMFSDHLRQDLSELNSET